MARSIIIALIIVIVIVVVAWYLINHDTSTQIPSDSQSVTDPNLLPEPVVPSGGDQTNPSAPSAQAQS